MTSKRLHINISNNSFFETKLPINAPVQLEYGSQKWMTTIRGSKFSKFILTNTPKPKEGIEQLESRKIFVRFLVEGIVYGYEALFIKLESNPPVLVLEYPKSIYMFNLRNNRRMKILHPVEIFFDKDSKITNGALMDFSDQGAMVSMDKSIKLRYGQVFSISSTLPNNVKMKSLLCKVLSAKLSCDKQLVGVSFDTDNNSSSEIALSSIKSFFKYCSKICAGREVRAGGAYNQDQEIFFVGQGIVLEYQRKPMKSFVRGCRILRNEGYILCDIPEIKDSKLLPKLSDVITVNYTLKGKKCKTVMEFDATLYKTNLWKLKYLIEAIEYAFRKEERCECLIAARMSYKMGKKIEEIGEGFLDDISLSGAEIITRKPIVMHSGSIINVSFQLGDFGTIEYQDFKVIRKISNNKIYEYAGKFITMKDEDMDKLAKFIEFCMEWKLE